ncbi:MAG: hypothetical protein RI894_51, partial [Bacteroidota bacterium]
LRPIFTTFIRPSLLAFFPLSLLWFCAHFAFEVDKIAGVQHLIYLFFGASIIFLFNYFTENNTQILARATRIIAVILLINIGLGLLETMSIIRFPISDYSPLCGYFGRTLKYYHNISMTSSNLDLLTAKQLIDSTPTGFYCNPNDCATVVSMCFPFFLLHRNKFIATLGMSSVLLVDVGTSARLVLLGVWLMFAVSFFFINKKNWQNFLIAIVLLFASLSNGYTFLAGNWRQLNEVSIIGKVKLDDTLSNGKWHTLSRDKLSPKFELDTSTIQHDNSTNIRKELIIAGFNTAKQHYGIGIGGGNMGAKLTRMGGIGTYKTKVLHNFWLEWLIEGGVIAAVGFALWYSWLLWSLYRTFRKKNDENDDLSTPFILQKENIAAIFVTLVGFVLTAIAQGTCIYFLPMYLLFAVAIKVSRSSN